MIDWSLLRSYLQEAEGYTNARMEDVSDIPRIDEQVTIAINLLGAGGYGLDLSDETTVYALVVGMCMAYRYGLTVTQTNPDHPFVRPYLHLHGTLSGNVAMVARQVVNNLGLTT